MLRSLAARLPSLSTGLPPPFPIHSSWQTVGCSALPIAAQHLSQLTGSQQQQSRSVISVKVYNNKVDAATRALSRIIVADRVFVAWKKKDFNLKPAAKRVEQQKETALRLKKRNFRQSLRLAMQRKDRYESPPPHPSGPGATPAPNGMHTACPLLLNCLRSSSGTLCNPFRASVFPCYVGCVAFAAAEQGMCGCRGY